QSVFRNATALGARNLIVVDEAHLIPPGGDGMYLSAIGALQQVCDLRIVGLTATPYRLDTGRLDQGEGRLFDRVVYSYGLGAGVNDGWLSPLVARSTEHEIDVAGVSSRGGEFVAGELEAA